MKRVFLTALAAALLSSAALAQEPKSYSPYVGQNFPTRVFFGDTHLHTKYSPDAALLGNSKLGPADAFRFARGEIIQAHNGMKAKLNRPLDFLVVTDHAEYIGIVTGLFSANPDLLATTSGKRWYDMLKKGGKESKIKVAYEILLGGKGKLIKDEKYFKSVWADIASTADRYNDPGKFTAFIGFEWTSMPRGNNLHRVVIFKDGAQKATQVLPFSALDSEAPEDLWKYLSKYEKNTGGKILAIAHNGNVSNGLMFLNKNSKGTPLSKAYAETRIRWEPLYEVTQMKGDGETHPYLSPNDIFADFETWDKSNITASVAKKLSMLKYEYAREALKMGLKHEKILGVNPFKFGLIGSTDSHTSMATAEENNQWGKLTNKEPNKHRATDTIIPSQTDKSLEIIGYRQAASGYAAVWATENTRKAIFEAMQRRETYATTGPRMTVRFFGGWDFKAKDVFSPDYVKIGYSKGVPMGGDLTKAPTNKAPKFMIVAVKDALGANLDRVQIVKGWLNNRGELQEKVYDVALAGGRKPGAKANSIGSTVNLASATYTNTIGDVQLATVWTDPDFNPSERAFYYVRVIEIPKPRWTAYDAKFFKLKMPKGAKMVVQDRAYTSPIWYTP